MTWKVFTTLPGSQHPQRVLHREEVRGPKGYRIVASIDPRVSAIERELSVRQIPFYMPSEFKVVRNRRKTGMWTIRRFPLLPRYIFVDGFVNWREIPGLRGCLHHDGKPLELSVFDIMALRTYEAHSEEAAERFFSQVMSEDRAKATRTAKASAKLAKRRFNPGKKVKVMWGSEAGRNAVVLGWADQHRVDALVERLDGAEVVTMPYEFIRVQDAAE